MTPLTGPQLAARIRQLDDHYQRWLEQWAGHYGTSLAALESGDPVPQDTVDELAGHLAKCAPTVLDDPAGTPPQIVDAFPDATVVGTEPEPELTPDQADPGRVGELRQHGRLRALCPSTVPEVKAWATTPARVVAAIDNEERRRQPRSTLLAWLEEQLNGFDDPDQPIRVAISHLEAALVCLNHLGGTDADRP